MIVSHNKCVVCDHARSIHGAGDGIAPNCSFTSCINDHKHPNFLPIHPPELLKEIRQLLGLPKVDHIIKIPHIPTMVDKLFEEGE